MERGVHIFPGDENVSLNTSFAVRKLLDVNLYKGYDISGVGRGNGYDESGNENEDDDADDSSSIQHAAIFNTDKSLNVSYLSLGDFRNRLFVHFNIAFKNKLLFGHDDKLDVKLYKIFVNISITSLIHKKYQTYDYYRQ